MITEKSNNLNRIKVNESAIIKAVELICHTCYGVRDLKNKSLFYVDKKEINPKECILVTKYKDEYRIRIYVAIMSTIKISECLNEIQKRVAYEISHRFDVKVKQVDVYVQQIVNEL